MKGVLAVIPARGGSKGVPRKNIRLLAGKPLIAHSIATALRCRVVERTVVSTDDEEIRDVATACGAEVPFLRPKELGQDDTPDRPALAHALQWLREQEGYIPHYVLFLRPTSPLRTVESVEETLALMQSTQADSVRTVTDAVGVHHPYWMYRMDGEGRAHAFIDGVEIEKYYQRQLLPKAYRLNSLVDCMKADVIMHHEKSQYGDDMRLLPTPESISMDIDTEDDFAVCETLLLKIRDIHQ